MPRPLNRVLSNRARLRCELLEERDAPATFTVNDPGTQGAADAKKSEVTAGGKVTLQSIFDRMNVLGGAHTINFSGPIDIAGGDYFYSKGGVTINGIAGAPGAGPQVKIHGSVDVGPGSNVHDLYISGASGSGLTVRGNSKVANNVLSGNGFYGLYMEGSGNKATGNIIGLMPDGKTAQGNFDDGVVLFGSNNTVGGTSAADRNIISANGRHGINMFSSTPPFAANNCVMIGNYIGTSQDGGTPLPNGQYGINIQGNGNRVGGMSPGEGNLVVSANGGVGGIQVNQGSGVSTGNKIQKNLVGTKVDGLGMFTPEADNPGSIFGINIREGTAFTVIQANVVADYKIGIELQGGDLPGTQVVGNMVGVGLDGQTRLRNKDGIVIVGANNVKIGGTTAGTRNTISGNSRDGIAIVVGSSKDQIIGNYIGTNFAGDDLGNGVHGIHIYDGHDNVFGTAKGAAINKAAANNIAFNGNDWASIMTADQRGYAIQIDVGGSNIHNTIRGNVFHDNKSLSIYLDDAAHQNELPQNDVATVAASGKQTKFADSDTGANNLQNFPVLTSVAKGKMRWELNTNQDAVYTVDFYVDTKLADSGYGEGQTYLMSKTIDTDGLGHGFVEIPLTAGQLLSAMVTSPSGDTSAFSIIDTDADGLANAWETKGIDFDMTGDSILTLPGADPIKKDIYLEADVMSGVYSVNMANVFNLVTQAFANAPATVGNPDGSAGVHLHINPDIAASSVPFSDNWSDLWGDFGTAKDSGFGDGLSDTQKKARALAYRYTVLINGFTAPDDNQIGYSGYAELTPFIDTKNPNKALGGNEFVVAVPPYFFGNAPGGLNTVTDNDVAGTLMHELGHTLGLQHGGVDSLNYKPNYYSVMSYDWQMPGLLYRNNVVDADYSSSWSLDYSAFALKSIDENGTADFNIGFDPSKMVPIGQVWDTKSGWAYPNIPNQLYRLVPMAGNVKRLIASAADFKAFGMSGKVDLNYDDFAARAASPVFSMLKGADDWSNLIYGFRESPSSAKGQHGAEVSELNFKDFGPKPRGHQAVDPVVIGSDAGSPPRVQTLGADGKVVLDFMPFDAAFTGGVRVSKGDVNGDHVADVIAAMGPGGDTVAAFDGTNGSLLFAPVQPYGKGFTGGVNVAAGDVDGDGHVDIIVAPAGGTGSNVLILDGMTGATKRTILAYATTTKTGVNVAVGDVNGDGKMDIIVAPGSGAGPLVKIFNGPDGKFMKSFAVSSPAYNGVYLAAADFNGDGKADIVAGAGGGPATALPVVRIYSGANPAKLLAAYYVDAPTFHGGVRVAVVKTDNGKFDVLTTTGPGHQAHLRRYAGLSVVDNWTTDLFDNTFNGAFVG